MQTSTAGRAAIARREGTKLVAYQDGGGVWTIGTGHTSAAGAPHVTAGMRITAAEADQILSRDLAATEAAVTKAVHVPLAQHEFDALVSLAFNIGAGAFALSTLVKKLNAGDRQGAADQFLVWDKDGGKVIQGLVNRRRDERAQFLGTNGDMPATPAGGSVDAHPTLMRGASGPAVLALQRALAAAGIAIVADGVFGPATERAVRQFQHDRNIEPDGIVGPKTWAALGA